MRRCLHRFFIGLLTLSLVAAPAHACWRSRQARHCRPVQVVPARQPAPWAACCEPCGDRGRGSSLWSRSWTAAPTVVPAAGCADGDGGRGRVAACCRRGCRRRRRGGCLDRRVAANDHERNAGGVELGLRRRPCRQASSRCDAAGARAGRRRDACHEPPAVRMAERAGCPRSRPAGAERAAEPATAPSRELSLQTEPRLDAARTR